jgi:pyruvate/2-oxoglutarate dehydrogenase complex dihydrolipoamide acyltransferase (E2) component
LDYPVTNVFDPPTEPGTDYATPVGVPIYSPVDGKAIVMDTGNVAGAGHLSDWNVSNGQDVHIGDLIGYTGDTGDSTGPHVELFYKVRGAFVDPTTIPGLINSFFTGSGGAAVPGGGTGGGLPDASTGDCQTFAIHWPGAWGAGAFDFCFDPIVGGFAMLGGGILMLGGIAVLVAFALKETSAGRTASRAVGYMGAPVNAVVKAQASRQEARLKMAQDSEAARRSAVDRQHREGVQRSQLRTSRARARVAEAQARFVRGGKSGNVESSARRKAASGRFSDFTEQEVQWAEKNPNALRDAIKGAA